MKKYLILSLIGLILLMGSLFIYMNHKTNNDLTKIKVAEVTHSPFYAPFYVAIENGYFKDEGLDIDLILTSGADKVSAAVLSKDVEIGFCGPESTIYIYNGGEKNYLVNFAGLTKRDGQFIVSRKKEKNFELNDLKGKEVIVGRLGGMPAINFKNALKKNDVKGVKENYSVEYANLSSAFISGVGDYVNLFEPNATILEKMGFGYIVESIGNKSDTVPYTAFNTRLAYAQNNKEILIKFNNALNKGLDYTANNTSKDIAKVIAPQFPDIALNDLVKIVDNYKNADTWYQNTSINKDDFVNLENILINNDLIKKYVSYDKLILDLNE